MISSHSRWGVEICVHYGFVWISEPMVGTLFAQLCLQTVLSAHYRAFINIDSGHKYKNEDNTYYHDCVKFV